MWRTCPALPQWQSDICLCLLAVTRWLSPPPVPLVPWAGGACSISALPVSRVLGEQVLSLPLAGICHGERQSPCPEQQCPSPGNGCSIWERGQSALETLQKVWYCIPKNYWIYYFSLFQHDMSKFSEVTCWSKYSLLLPFPRTFYPWLDKWWHCCVTNLADFHSVW